MPTESSVVSNLIRQVHGGRLRTDPGDAHLFQPAASAREPRSWHAPTIAAPQAKPRPVATPAVAPKRPTAPKRERTWPWIAATLVAGAIGLGAAAYFDPFGFGDAPAAAVTPAPVAAPAPIVAPPIAAPAAEPARVEPPTIPAATEPPPPEPTIAPAQPAKHHATKVKPKHAVAKHAKPAKTAPAAAPAPAEEAPPPAPPPPAAPKHRSQSADTENPL